MAWRLTANNKLILRKERRREATGRKKKNRERREINRDSLGKEEAR